ncbi:tyrosine-type recombinase/integrase [Agromyces atrinae]|uniref:site-specific integrase n=1 Tax=Agromyces atrinae TaxID=592376 RepID=UPI001F56D3B1|nr:tyrosine-type recombinase/integrase [Agromyces atrinae]MCI2959512.1 tyrosine-type recombinase/integrase [Agromyces atrinae]
MARPPLVLGTWGRITRTQRASGWVAYARFRDYDGVTRQVERKGKTGASAERELLAALRDRARLPSEEITPETRLVRVIDDWVAELEKRDLSDGTKDVYGQQLKHIRKAMGALQLREVTVPAVDRFLIAITESSGPETARLSRVVLSGICKLAVRKGAMLSNPVRDAGPTPKNKTEVLTLDVAAVLIVRSQLRSWDGGYDYAGRLRQTDLVDPVDMIVGTGMRTGEVFALRWEDLAFGDDPRAHVNGTARYQRGEGLVRQSHPKSEESNRSLKLPPFVVAMLAARPREGDFVFPSATGTMRSPHNFRTQWRAFRSAHGYEEWVTPKTFRKAVATEIAQAMGAEAAKQQLGHADLAVTRKHYLKTAHDGPDVRAILELFAS